MSWGGNKTVSFAHSQLAQLASMTVLSIDTGDLDIVEKFAATGYITDATTNPLFVSQAGLSGDPRYVAFVDEAITVGPLRVRAAVPAPASARVSVCKGVIYLRYVACVHL